MSRDFTYKPLDSVYKPMNNKDTEKQDTYESWQDEPEVGTAEDYRSRTPDSEL